MTSVVFGGRIRDQGYATLQVENAFLCSRRPKVHTQRAQNTHRSRAFPLQASARQDPARVSEDMSVDRAQMSHTLELHPCLRAHGESHSAHI